jgi:hypothetical protein
MERMLMATERDLHDAGTLKSFVAGNLGRKGEIIGGPTRIDTFVVYNDAPWVCFVAAVEVPE